MFNPYHSEPAKIVKITEQTSSIKLFRLEFIQKVWGYSFNFQPGQFIELSLPGFGEAPFAPCGESGARYLELCVRACGRLTNRLHEMKVGDVIGIRGPYGKGWPINFGYNNISSVIPAKAGIQDSGSRVKPGMTNSVKKNLIIVVGGLGLIPFRTLILDKEKFLGPDTKIQIFYGAKNSSEMLFRYEYNRWRQKNIEIRLTVDKECVGWSGCTGLVTTLFDKFPLMENSRAFLCGPAAMYKPAIAKLKEKNIAEDDIFLSLERRMHCGVGVCQHCAVGPFYTCKDGPVFAYNKIKDIPEAI